MARAASPHPNPLAEGAGVVRSLSRVRERAGVRVQSARALRETATTAEQRLWQHLRNRQLSGFKFRRQHPISPYIADFACIEAHLVVELDGGQHAQDQVSAYDERRTQFLQSQGWQVLRFWNHEGMTELPAVLQVIARALEDHPHPRPLPHAGEGAETQGH